MNAEAKPRPISRWDHWYRRALPAYWIFLFCITHFPHLTLPKELPQSDKWAHLGAFGLLAFLLWRFVESLRRPVAGWVPFVAWAGIAVYAAIDERTQPLFNRTCDLVDWAVDVTGAAVVLALLEIRRRRVQRRTPVA